MAFINRVNQNSISNEEVITILLIIISLKYLY